MSNNKKEETKFERLGLLTWPAVVKEADPEKEQHSPRVRPLSQFTLNFVKTLIVFSGTYFGKYIVSLFN